MQYVKDDSLTNFPFWSGAKSNADMLTYDELQQLDDVLPEYFNTGDGQLPTETEINDMFWFDFATVCEAIGLQYDADKDEIIRDGDENESRKKAESTDIMGKLKSLETITDAGELIDAIKALGFYEIEYGDYGDHNGKSYAVFKGPNGEYAELDYNWKQPVRGKDSWIPNEVETYNFYADKASYEDDHGYSPRE